MKIGRSVLALIFIFAAGAAFAECPNNSPISDWNTLSGDQRVDASYLQKLLPGRKVKFGAKGTEIYNKNGTYAYRVSGRSYHAPGYKFYKNGVRCINYRNNPRFDLYVINNNRLILVNSGGGRLDGKLTN